MNSSASLELKVEDGSFRPIRRIVRSLSGSLADALVVLLLAGAVIVLYGVYTDFVPTGADPGNWLAIARERLGRDVMSTDVSYLPLFPGVLAGLLVVAQPIGALNIAAILSIGALVVAVYLCSRAIGRGFAIAAAVVVMTAGAQTEAYAWGGYPQILATAFGLLGTLFLIRLHETGRWVHLFAGWGLVAAALATHAMVGGLLVVTLVVGTGHWIYLRRVRSRRWRPLIIGFATAGVAGIVVLVSSLLGPPDVSPTLNPAEADRVESLFSLVREAPAPWALMALLAVPPLVYRSWPPATAVMVSVASGWMASGALFFLVSKEPRSLMLVQVGVVLSGVVSIASGLRWLRRRGHQDSRRRTDMVTYRVAVLATVSVFSALTVSGLVAYSVNTAWYRLVGEGELAALDRLREAADGDSLIIASRGRHTMPVGWWTEGYAGVPTYSGHDVRYLAFPDEREQAETANDLFGGELTHEESLAIFDDVGADFVVVDRLGPHAQWLRSELAQQLAVVDDSSNIVILRVPRTQGSSPNTSTPPAVSLTPKR